MRVYAPFVVRSEGYCTIINFNLQLRLRRV